MPMRRSRFPDYFGSRSIEPVNRRRQDYRDIDEIPDAGIENGEEDGPDPYAVQRIALPEAMPMPSYPRSSAFQPNQWAHSGTQPAARRAPPARQNDLGRFAFREPESARAVSLAPRTQAAAYNVVTPRHQSTRSHHNPDRLLPQTPWSDRQTARLNWLRRPREEQISEAYRPSVYENSYEVQPVRQDRGRPLQALAPPTPRHSSPSPLSGIQALVHPLRNASPRVDGIELISPRSLEKRFHSIFPYEYFNAVQSSCFHCVYGSNYNIVVAAPTGSGKTVIFELAICKLLAQRDKKDFKIVYQAPTKALCSERARDWQTKFKALGLQVAEFTGDTSAVEVRRVRTASIIITTPEKWDSITRKWSDHGALLKTIKLVLIDEVHILKDMRGATLETVVSRMKTLGSEVRFIALSATIPNSTDIAQWLGLTHTSPQMPAKTFVFGEEYRPVHLEKIVLGYNLGGGNEHSFDSILDDQLPDLIVKHAQGKPVLIFCFTRKSTESAAMVLADYWTTCPPSQKPWPGPSVAIRSSAARLQNAVTSGVAFHHGGLERQDRGSVEEAFLRGHLSIVCCTSTLAVGVNLPCHTVILKGTTGYQNGKFAEYDEFEVMQMIGRAGRPQFDTSATAIILTRVENREKYRTIGSGSQTVESTLHLNLIEHLNSEIVLSTISSLATAVRWLRGTFLAVRLRQNPDHYHLTDAHIHARTIDDQLEEICKAGIARLADVGLIRYIDDTGSEFCGTQYGSAMSTYMVRFETMEMILGFPKIMTMEELLNSLCRASEFDEFRVKSTERPALRELNKTQDIPFKFKDNIAETWQKISLLIQVELSRGTLPYQQRIAIEAKQAIECMQRLLESYIVCTIADNNGNGAKVALEFSRSLLSRAWEGDPAQLCQVPDIGPANMKKLVDKQVMTVLELADLGPVGIESFLSKNPPAAMKIADSMRSFPRLMVDGYVTVARTGGNNGGTSTADTERKAVAKVKFGCTNENGLPRWRNKVPAATFFAQTAEGSLLHIWRGRLQDKQNEVTFPVQTTDASTVLCYFACDEIVGTIQSRQLPCVDVPHEGIQTQCVGDTSNNRARPTLSMTRNTKEPNPPKKQKLQHYSSRPIVIGDVVVDSIDLSTADDEGRSGKPPHPKCISEAPTYSTSKRERRDSFAFQNISVRNPKHCSGGGTAQDPFTLDDSGSDDFDTDIFDDVEFPAIKASPKIDTLLPKTIPGETFQPRQSSKNTGKASPDTELGSLRSTHVHDTTAHCSVEPVIPATPPIFDDVVDMNHQTEDASGSKKCVLPARDVVVPCEGGREQEERVNADGTLKSAEDIPTEPSEPSWVDASNNSVIDFLRGHVKFV